MSSTESEPLKETCACGHGLYPNHLTSDSSKSDEHFIREAAIAKIALDALIYHDSSSAENAIGWARSLMDDYEHTEHYGDCTKQAITCFRCICDEAKREVRMEHDA